MHKPFFAWVAMCCTAAVAQVLGAGGVAADFPPQAQTPSAAQLAERLNGHLFTARLANGTTWRIDYKSSSGYVFYDVSSGGRDTAKWRTEDGRACFEFRGAFPSGCAEFRLIGDVLHFKRASTGEIVAMEKN